MKAVVQRVCFAKVEIEKQLQAQIEKGFLVLLGVMEGDEKAEAEKLAKKICELRIFEDENGKMNRSISDIDGELLIVSQFTLAADCSHGRRPSFIRAQRPEKAIPLYEYFIEQTQSYLQKPVQTGVFGADMQVSLLNDGPVTIILDSEELKG